ncbi:methyltransferase type 11 [Mucilaginibacter sp.]|uniref:methyltransferase type 11 n=1 Tax=Mucilaginibacter sp. TaxID=1882438 RepID=UPI0026133F08|nr:methyltransferase type 11 [Mucilaginibacter sp.]MDB4926825.1 hypothetical protein [Mucilaginibacter sp.]
MKQIEIFKTNVGDTVEAEVIIKCLLDHYPHYKINFDLEDCDRVLRIEASQSAINEKEIEQILIKQGYDCCHLL